MISVKVWTPETDNFIHKRSISEEKTNQILMKRAMNENIMKQPKKNLQINREEEINNWISNIQNINKNKDLNKDLDNNSNLDNNNPNINSNNALKNNTKKSSPYKKINFYTCICCKLELARSEFSNIELAKIHNRKRCMNCQKKTEKKYREKNEETIWENAIKMGHVIDGFCPERLRENFRNKGIWSETYQEKCRQIQLSLELTGISNKNLDNETEIDLIEDTIIVDNQGVDTNNEIVKNYVYKSIPGVYEIPYEISNKLVEKFGKKFKIVENIYKLFQPDTLGV